MNDRVFLDTNVLVYAHTDTDTSKQKSAQQLVASTKSHISTQVLQELANTLRRKFKLSWADISIIISDEISNNVVLINNEVTINAALKIAERYGFTFYDSMIISAAIECQSAILYSEDLQDGQIIDGKLTIKKPFL